MDRERDLSQNRAGQLVALRQPKISARVPVMVPQVEIDAAWAEEIERRVRDLEAGSVETQPPETVIRELRGKHA